MKHSAGWTGGIRTLHPGRIPCTTRDSGLGQHFFLSIGLQNNRAHQSSFSAHVVVLKNELLQTSRPGSATYEFFVLGRVFKCVSVSSSYREDETHSMGLNEIAHAGLLVWYWAQIACQYETMCCSGLTKNYPYGDTDRFTYHLLHLGN